ncbi:MAG TPA: hypothetical protein ENN77_01525, partial [Candidatus Wirthbacteria bacterium]|nr:hypothetical protein [Candidatus Wirthbacteria bacterium]
PFVENHARVLGVPPFCDELVPEVGSFTNLFGQKRQWIKAVAIMDTKQKKAIITQMQNDFAGLLNFSPAHGTASDGTDLLYCNITHPSVSKGNALKLLLKDLKKLPQEAMAIGDSFNDQTMFEVAGTRIAMANAHPDLLALADHIVSSVENSGVAEAIDKLV